MPRVGALRCVFYGQVRAPIGAISGRIKFRGLSMALTAKQRRFVEEYLVDLNATQAAIRAGEGD